jgi:hypothetical protein
MRPTTTINTESISATKPFERFRQFAKKVMAVPKAEIDKREAEYKHERHKQRTKLRKELG